MYKKYKIFSGDNYENMVNSVKILLANGYLLGKQYRIDKISNEQYYEFYYKAMVSGKWIVFGSDPICRRTFETIESFFFFDFGENDCITITLEEFLKLNYQEQKA